MKSFLFLAFLVSSIHAADWPSWRGPAGNGTANYGAQLITNVANAKLLWKSEAEDIPMGWLHPNGFNCTGIVGGYGGPVVVGGRVYLAYYVPAGDLVDTNSAAKAKDPRPEKWKVHSDDVLLCLDAETGKTLWKTALAGVGANHQYHAHGPLQQPVVAEGRVFWTGSGGLVHAVDAVTGKHAWSARLGTVTDLLDKWKDAGWTICSPACKAAPAKVTVTWLNGNPAVAAGVVANNDYQGNVIAFDAVTGKERWTVTNCIADISSPVVWTHKGTPYFVAAGPNRAVAIEPRTGKVLWAITPWKEQVTAPMIPGNALRSGAPIETNKYKRLPPVQVINRCGTPAVTEDFLVLQDTGIHNMDYPTISTNQSGLTCFRIDPTGAKLAWSLPAGGAYGNHASALICGQYAYGGGPKNAVRVRLDTGTVVTTNCGVGVSLVSALAGDGRILQQGTMYLAEGDEFRKLGGLKISLLEHTAPFLANGRLYCRGDNGKGDKQNPRCAVYCYDLRQSGK